MAKGMTHYLQYLTLHNESDPNLTTDMNRANRNEYKEIFRRIKEDDLPRLLPKFQKRLRENTIQDMAIFQSKLFTARDGSGRKSRKSTIPSMISTTIRVIISKSNAWKR